jgi:hypothetical protein
MPKNNGKNDPFFKQQTQFPAFALLATGKNVKKNFFPVKILLG